MKRCSHCQQEKGPTAFWRDTTKPGGLDRICQACRNAIKQARKAGWCLNCLNGRHGPDCAAAYFGPDCTCRCGVLGYRGPFPFADPTAPAPMDRETA